MNKKEKLKILNSIRKDIIQGEVKIKKSSNHDKIIQNNLKEFKKK